MPRHLRANGRRRLPDPNPAIQHTDFGYVLAKLLDPSHATQFMETAGMGKKAREAVIPPRCPPRWRLKDSRTSSGRERTKKRTKIMTQFEMEQQWEERNMRLAWSDTCEPDRTYHEQEGRRARDRARRERAWEQQQARDEERQRRSAAEEEHRRRQEQQRLESEYRREEERRRLEEQRRYDDQRREEQRRRDEETRRNREEERRRANRR